MKKHQDLQVTLNHHHRYGTSSQYAIPHPSKLKLSWARFYTSHIVPKEVVFPDHLNSYELPNFHSNDNSWIDKKFIHLLW